MCLRKLWFFHSMKNEKLKVKQLFWQRIRWLPEHISSKVWENCKRLESRLEWGASGSVIELVKLKQIFKNVDHFTTWRVGVLQKFWQFQPKGLSQNNFRIILPVYKVHLQFLPLAFCGSFVLLSNSKLGNLEFLVSII